MRKEKSMTLGLSIPVFTALHVAISLVAIGSGLFAIFGLMRGELRARWTALFLVMTALTSITGFMFPFKGVTPGIVLGVLSLIVSLPAIAALYVTKLRGGWRGTYVVAASLVLYFNVFVLFAQLFAKTPALRAIAPTQSSPVFGATQLIVLAIFVVLTIRAFKRFGAVGV